MNEFELIKKLTKNLPQKKDDLVLGVGDDCAVFKDKKSDNAWLISSDVLIENIHFKREFTNFKNLGRKALNVNLSDVNAMGGRSKFFLVSIAIPSDLCEDEVLDIYVGMNEVASKEGVILIGGDTTSSEKDLVISITILGDAAKNEIVYRSGAKEDDLICVTNILGSSALGLELLRRGVEEEGGHIENHINPKPPLDIGPLLAKSGIATSMLDISDGLLGDLGHICDRSGVGARIYWDKIPLKDGFVDICDSYHLNPMDLALAGGEDYELLFTVSKEKEGDLNKLIESNQLCATIIGLIVNKDNGIRVFGKDNKEIVVAQRGYEHLK